MSSQTKITITHDKENTIDVQNQVIVNAMTSKTHAEQLRTLLNALESGVRNGSIQTVVDDGNGVAATGVITYSGVATAGDTVLVNGVTLTAVASGAVSGQFNVGTTAATQAANLASGINATTTLSGIVTAAAVGAVVTVSAASAGVIGNAVTLALGTNTGSVAVLSGVSGGRLSGGVAPTNPSSVTYKFGV